MPGRLEKRNHEGQRDDADHSRTSIDGRTTLRLEGSLGTEWADLLERECSGHLHAGVSLTLDLAGVDFVDRLGVETLRRLRRDGVEIRCRCGAVASVLEAEGVRITCDEAIDGDSSGKGGATAE